MLHDFDIKMILTIGGLCVFEKSCTDLKYIQNPTENEQEIDYFSCLIYC